jgi:putative Ca2+/H+ antiporter (TMEM165/GDT1 family)
MNRRAQPALEAPEREVPQRTFLRITPEEDGVDLKTLITTFGLIFLAELGDKTQFAALCLSADSDSRLAVFLGAALALVTSSLLAVLLGAVLARCFPPYVVKTVAGLLFIVMGVVMLVTR